MAPGKRGRTGYSSKSACKRPKKNEKGGWPMEKWSKLGIAVIAVFSLLCLGVNEVMFLLPNSAPWNNLRYPQADFFPKKKSAWLVENHSSLTAEHFSSSRYIKLAGPWLPGRFLFELSKPRILSIFLQPGKRRPPQSYYSCLTENSFFRIFNPVLWDWRSPRGIVKRGAEGLPGLYQFKASVFLFSQRNSWSNNG